jgi:hypothetical protein
VAREAVVGYTRDISPPERVQTENGPVPHAPSFGRLMVDCPIGQLLVLSDVGDRLAGASEGGGVGL